MGVLDASKLIHPTLDVDIGIEVDKNLCITANYSLVNQIVTNIVSNIYYHGFNEIDKPKLIIKVEIAQMQASIALHNNGVAIPEEVSAHMFEPFFTTARHKGGTGLGLSAAFNAATLLKGKIDYQANSPLGGPLFTLLFPIERQHEYVI